MGEDGRREKKSDNANEYQRRLVCKEHSLQTSANEMDDYVVGSRLGHVRAPRRLQLTKLRT